MVALDAPPLRGCARVVVRRGFTLIEMLVVLTIISVLATLAYPVAIQSSKQYQLILCLQQGRRLGQATIQYFHDGGEASVSMSPETWMSTLERYGMQRDRWVCPTRRWSGAEIRKGSPDYFYAGAPAAAIRTGENPGELYMWVEQYPNHDGLHVIVMGDGRVNTENLLNVEF